MFLGGAENSGAILSLMKIFLPNPEKYLPQMKKMLDTPLPLNKYKGGKGRW
jgi:hypothetical protein